MEQNREGEELSVDTQGLGQPEDEQQGGPGQPDMEQSEEGQEVTANNHGGGH